MMRRFRHPDFLAVVLLIALWLLFFWRLFTPFEGDQASLTLGDFSGQFVAFGGYQYQRFAQGEIPLWNPYNNGGLPFIADTQAAVFYPPRLITIGLSKLVGGWTYHALELEMTAHVLAYTLMMYMLVRRMTSGQLGSVFGALVAAVVAGYCGYTAGYPPLQLALLEAAIWLPMGVLGIFEATRNPTLRWHWLMISGIALGLSWMAGHPQTSYFLTLLLVLYYAYRCFIQKIHWTRWAAGTAILGAISFGISAVQLLPGFEYLRYTSRAGYEFEAKNNGFPIQDVIQFVFPQIVSVFSPLYIGVTGLVLALIALVRRLPGSLFWGIVALVGLAWGFGGNSVVYPLLYNLLPGLRFFRGQERAAYLVINSLAILAGLGAVHLASWDILRDYAAVLRMRINLNRLFLACLGFMGLIAAVWIGNPQGYGHVIAPITLSTVTTGLLQLLLPATVAQKHGHVWRWSLLALLVFELYTVNMDAEPVYDPIPASQQIAMSPPPLIAPLLDDSEMPFRVDGFRGVHDNYGSLYGVMDMRGISPLFLSGPFALIGGCPASCRQGWDASGMGSVNPLLAM